jgi:hypothetical protein
MAQMKPKVFLTKKLAPFTFSPCNKLDISSLSLSLHPKTPMATTLPYQLHDVDLVLRPAFSFSAKNYTPIAQVKSNREKNLRTHKDEDDFLGRATPFEIRHAVIHLRITNI